MTTEIETKKYRGKKPRYTIKAISDDRYTALLAQGFEAVNLNRTKVCGFFSINDHANGFEVIGHGPASGIRKVVKHDGFGPVAYCLPALVNGKLSLITVAGLLLPNHPIQ
jgi:hypothetical protein